MAEMTRERRVGLTVLMALAALGGLVVFLGRIHFNAPGYALHASFRYVDSLKVDAPVLYGGGVKIGIVDSVDVKDGLVRLKLHIFRKFQLPKDSTVTIHTSGILGEKYVQINAGNISSGILEPGSHLSGIDPGSIDRTLQRVEMLTEVLAPLLEDPKLKKGFAAAMGNLDKLTAELATLVSDTSGDIRVSVRNLKELSASLRARTDDFKEIATSARGMLNEKNRANLESSLSSLHSTLGKLDKVMLQIDSKKGPLGAMVYDEESAENLRQLLKDLKRHPWKLLWKK